MRTSTLFLFFLLSFSFSSLSSITSFRPTQPLGWMHALPVGESPGWISDQWSSMEFSQSNMWNANTQFSVSGSDSTFNYGADYEQTSAILEVGTVIGESWAFSVESGYAKRDGGALDQLIDNFHVAVGSQRFSRQDTEFFLNNYSVQVDGSERIQSTRFFDQSYVKYKLKKLWWSAGECPCGLATSVQIKQPLSRTSLGFSSGSWDTSFAVHFGLPIGALSSFWITGAYTWLGENSVFQDWPLFRNHQMYEASFDFASSESFSYILQIRGESPFMNSDQLDIVYTTTGDRAQGDEQIASGLNSLERWRIYQAIGFKWKMATISEFRFLFLEDLAIGQVDPDGSSTYTVNAPDLAFVTQFFFAF